MKEKPILFKAEMVRAILNGSKTMTRRIVNMDKLKARLTQRVTSDAILSMIKDFKPIDCPPGIYPAKIHKAGAVSVQARDGQWLGVKPGEFHFECPYADGDTHLGNYGDKKTLWTITPKDSRLWVKETWRKCFDDGSGTSFRADQTPGTPEDKGPWKSPLFLPRKRSRITLEITGVRVERLNQISEQDALEEGCMASLGQPYEFSAVQHYEKLWESINGKGSWVQNPWVWVMSFPKL